MLKLDWRKPANGVAAHPAWDLVLPAIAAGLWLRFGYSAFTISADARMQLYVASATLSALILAAVSFVCGLVYQSDSEYTVRVRSTFSRVLRRNWTSIVMSTLAGAVVCVASIAVDGRSPLVATAMTVFALALVSARFTRTVWWLRFTLLVQTEVDTHPEPYLVSVPNRQAS